MASQRTYLVTGAAGFIASEVCRQLLARGDRVIGLDELNDAYDPRIKQWRLDQLVKDDAFTFLRVDISDRAALAEAIGSLTPKPVAVINLAARAGVRQSVLTPDVYFQTNVQGTLNVLDYCRDHEVKKLILASTSSLYGAHNEVPFAENADTNRPLSPYAASKKAAEVLCHSYHHLYGLDITVFRFFTVYGPAGRPDMSIFRFVQWIAEDRPVTVFGDGTQSRDFTFVEDIARGTLLGLEPVGYEVFNLGSDHPHALSETIRLIEAELGKSARIDHRPMHDADVLRTWANIDRARERLGWEPNVDLREGIARAVAWYLEQRAWASEIETGR